MHGFRFCVFTGVLLLGLWAPVAHAHLSLLSPAVSKTGTGVLKDGPCGAADGAETGDVTEYVAGETITVRWEEFIDHPSHYRIAFDPDGEDGFADPVCIAHCDERRDPEPPEFEVSSSETVLMDMIADQSDCTRAAPCQYEQEVTLPSMACDNCTLQVIQVMYDKRPYEIGGNDNYYQCAKLKLTAAPVEDAGVDSSVDVGVPDAGASDADAPATPDATVSKDADIAEAAVDASVMEDEGGCRVSHQGSLPFGSLFLIAALLWRRRS